MGSVWSVCLFIVLEKPFMVHKWVNDSPILFPNSLTPHSGGLLWVSEHLFSYPGKRLHSTERLRSTLVKLQAQVYMDLHQGIKFEMGTKVWQLPKPPKSLFGTSFALPPPYCCLTQLFPGPTATLFCPSPAHSTSPSGPASPIIITPWVGFCCSSDAYRKTPALCVVWQCCWSAFQQCYQAVSTGEFYRYDWDEWVTEPSNPFP